MDTFRKMFDFLKESVSRFSIRTRMLVYLVVIYSITFFIVANRIRSLALADATKLTDTYTREYAEVMQSKLNCIMDATRTMGHMFESYEDIPEGKRREAYSAIMKNILQKNNEYLSVWSIWEPHSIDHLDSLYANQLGSTVIGNFAPTFYKKQGEIMQESNVNDTSKTKLFTSDYYTIPKSTHQETVLEPYLYSYTGSTEDQILQTSLIYPIIRNNNFLGVVAVDVDLNLLHEIINKVSPFDGSYAFLISGSGKYVAHPSNKLLGKSFVNNFDSKEKSEAIISAIADNKDISLFEQDPYSGKKIYYSFHPIKIGSSNSNWAVGFSVPERSVAKQVFGNFYIALIAGLVGFILLIFVIIRISDDITQPLIKTNEVLKSLSVGDISVSKIQEIQNHDAIGEIAKSVNKLLDGLKETAIFATEIGKGNLNTNFELLSDKDVLGHSLIEMRDSLKIAQKHELDRKIEDEKRNWANNGIAKFSEVLRQNNDNLRELSNDIIVNLVKYLDSNQGGIFVINDEESNDVWVEMTACIAYDRRRYHQKRLELGEGLIGRCIQEKETIFLKEVPSDYIEITSGLGTSNPKCLLLVPLKVNESIFGVIEIASFKEFEKYQIEFLEKLGENIASTLSNVKINQNTQQLLNRFQQQSEEMTAQEEELRQNLEELQSTQEEMERIKKEEADRTSQMMKVIEENRSLLLDVLDKIPGKIFLKDENGKLLLLNSPVAKLYNKTVEELIGTSDFDNHPYDLAKEYRAKEVEIMENGAQTYVQEEVDHGELKFLKTTKMPFFIKHTSKTGLLGIQIDVSDIKNIELEMDKQRGLLQTAVDNYTKEKYLIDALMENIPDNIYFKDHESKFLRVSKAMLSLFHVQHPEELYGKSDFDFFSDEHARQAYNDEMKIIETGTPILDLIEKETWPDGTISWVSTTKMPLKDQTGKTIGTFGISRNVSKVKNMELVALQQKKMVELVVENLPVIIYEIDPKGKIVEFRGSGLAKMNLSEKDIVGIDFLTYYPQAKEIISNKAEEEISVSFTSDGEYQSKKWKFKHYLFDNKIKNGGFVGLAFEL